VRCWSRPAHRRAGRLFFFSSRRRHTRLVSDWSSDVCSSDLIAPKAMRLAMEKARKVGVGVVTVYNSGHFGAIGHYAMQAALRDKIGRASCRERVEISVGAGWLKKKKERERGGSEMRGRSERG